METKALYKFILDGGRMGRLEWLFVETPAKVSENVNREIVLIDALGKHSEFVVPLNNQFVHIVTRDQQFIRRMQDLGALVGDNPFDYLDEE